jgi:hypothetical protein
MLARRPGDREVAGDPVAAHSGRLGAPAIRLPLLDGLTACFLSFGMLSTLAIRAAPDARARVVLHLGRMGSDQPVIEINLRPGGRISTAAELLQTLLHQAAHPIAGSVKASEGRYHHAEYRQAAAGLGLDAQPDSTGWGQTSLASGTRTRYRNELAALDRALAKWEPTDQVKTERSSRNGVTLVCSCKPPRKIRIRGNPENVNIGDIRCEICEELFVPASAS